MAIYDLDGARNVAKRTFDRLADDPEYAHTHDSHRAAKALEAAEAYLLKQGERGTFGVESAAESGGFLYINTGETYETTILFHRGRFRVGCWGDIVEAASR